MLHQITQLKQRFTKYLSFCLPFSPSPYQYLRPYIPIHIRVCVPPLEKLWWEPGGAGFPVGLAAGGWAEGAHSQHHERAKRDDGGSGSELIQSLKKPPCLEELPTKGALSRLRVHIPVFFPAGPVTLLLVRNPAAFNGFRDVTGRGIWSYVLYENKTGPVLMRRI